MQKHHPLQPLVKLFRSSLLDTRPLHCTKTRDAEEREYCWKQMKEYILYAGMSKSVENAHEEKREILYHIIWQNEECILKT